MSTSSSPRQLVTPMVLTISSMFLSIYIEKLNRCPTNWLFCGPDISPINLVVHKVHFPKIVVTLCQQEFVLYKKSCYFLTLFLGQIFNRLLLQDLNAFHQYHYNFLLLQEQQLLSLNIAKFQYSYKLLWVLCLH